MKTCGICRTCALLLLLLTTSCERIKPQLTTSSASGGGSIQVVIAEGNAGSYSNLSATVGGKHAPARLGDGIIVVAMPMLDPGPAEFRLMSGDRTVLAEQIEVLEPPSRRLEIAIGPDGPEIARSTRSAARLTTYVRELGPRLCFDVFNAAGALVQTGSVAHPLYDGGEVFFPAETGEGAVSHRLVAASTGRFFITVPNPSAGWTLHLYEVPAGVDITTTKGRANRVLLKEMGL